MENVEKDIESPPPPQGMRSGELYHDQEDVDTNSGVCWAFPFSLLL